MTHVYVIAGTFDQAKQYINRKRAEYLNSGEPPLLMPNYLYVSGINNIRGIRNPKGVFIGAWKQRPDIIEVVETLMMASDSTNPALVDIYNELVHKHKPTPKKRPTPDDVVNAAAALLAKEIDKEVLNIAMKESKQWTMLPLKP